MAVPLAEAFKFVYAKLKASNPSAAIHQDALPNGVETGIVYRFVGAPMPTRAMGGEVLGEDPVVEVCAYGIGPSLACVDTLAQGIVTALTDASGTTSGGEVFGVLREHPVQLSRRIEGGDLEHRLGWRWRLYLRADV